MTPELDDSAETVRVSRLTAWHSSLNPKEKARADSICATAREELARCYQNRVNDLVAERLMENLQISDKMSITVRSEWNQMPLSRADWKRYWTAAVASDVWAARCVVSRDHERRVRLKNKFLATISAANRLNYLRDGSLDRRTADHVEAGMERAMEGLS